jgi:hypothetical protein
MAPQICDAGGERLAKFALEETHDETRVQVRRLEGSVERWPSNVIIISTTSELSPRSLMSLKDLRRSHVDWSLLLENLDSR